MKNSEVLEHLRLAVCNITDAIFELEEVNANMSVAELKRVRERVDELINLVELEDEQMA